MWVSKTEWDRLVTQYERYMTMFVTERERTAALGADVTAYLGQKAKDDITIDWMRHRINALEKQNAILLQKAAGVVLPVPEIVPTRPGTLSASKMELPNFDALPSFEDVGDEEAQRMGIVHDDDGSAVYLK